MTIEQLKTYIKDIFYRKKEEFKFPIGKLSDKHKFMVKMTHPDYINTDEDYYCIGDNVVVQEDVWLKYYKGKA